MYVCVSIHDKNCKVCATFVSVGYNLYYIRMHFDTHTVLCTHLYVRMYVRTYVHMYVHMYVCKYVCMYVLPYPLSVNLFVYTKHVYVVYIVDSH